MASHHWAARCKPTAPWGTTRLPTAGGRQASHMDLIRAWQTCSIGVPQPTRSRMVLAGYKSGCSTLPVWAGFSQNEYLWCFHISDKPLESHNVVWIQMRLMAAAQCPTTKTNSCKSYPVHRGLKLSQCRVLWSLPDQCVDGPTLETQGGLHSFRQVTSKLEVSVPLTTETTLPPTSWSLTLIHIYV